MDVLYASRVLLQGFAKPLINDTIFTAQDHLIQATDL
jgi:hypothetical protein